ncbi:MAG: hypothetical protein E7543_05940 [Ruminococcaceae bacterium]|nr:hypothetical protein [Oscillospiraceae bacterium]
MKSFIKTERFIYIAIGAAFIAAFLTVYLLTDKKTDALLGAEPVVIHDVTSEEAVGDRTVYVTPSGKKYHLDGCDYLSERGMSVSRKDAEKAGYEACKYCQP